MSVTVSAVEAAARESNGINPYGGGGAGGKFRKKPYRRSHVATPYDRPPSSIRNVSGFLSSFGGGNDIGNDGWLRRIVDPAQRIITASAHKLFASVFQKRITRPSSPHPPESIQEGWENQQEVVNRPTREHQETVKEVQKASSVSDPGSFVDLENIFKQRTFSKSEIDHLVALLHARTLDSSVANEVEKAEVFSTGLHDLKEGSSSIVQKADGNENRLSATHAVVLDGNVASPANLAKSYMGTRLPKVVPSGLREDTLLITSSQQTPKLPVPPLVTTSSIHIGVHEKGYITSRSRGRSAIYSMARTPYARVHQTTSLKILKPMPKRGDGRSMAPQAYELERAPGSHALKRRSSIFENDTGSGGPLRRIRHKPDLLSQKNNNLLSSTSGAGRLMALPSSESKNKFTDQSVGNEGVAVPSRYMPSVTSKSTEIASKILEQLDKIVSPSKEKSSVVRVASLRDKVSLKLSPSDLRGKALKSLEHIDSSKFLEIASGSSKLDDSVSTSNQDSGAFALQDVDKVEQSGPSKTLFGFDQLPPASNPSEEASVNGNALLNHKVVDLEEANPLDVPSAPMIQTFKMSAHEDYFDFDDDDEQNETALIKLVDNGDKRDSIKMKPVLSAEADAKVEPVPEVHGLMGRKTVESLFSANSGEKTVSLSFSGIPPTKKNFEPDVQVASFNPVSETSISEKEPSVVKSVFTFGEKASLGDEDKTATTIFAFASNVPIVKDAEKFNGSSTLTSTSEKEPSVVSSVFTSGKKASSGNEDKTATPIFAFASNVPIVKDAEKFNGSSTENFASQSLLSESSSSFSISVGPVPSIAKATEMNKVGEEKDMSSRVLGTPVPASLTVMAPSTTGLFILTGPAAASQPSVSLAAGLNASPPERPLTNLPLVSSSAADGSDGKSILSQSVSNFSVQASPIFKFGSTNATPETPAMAPVEAQSTAVSGSEKAPLNPFSASSTSSASSIFGFSSPASNGASSDKLGSVSFGMSNGSSQVQTSTSRLGLSSSTQTVPFQFGSSAPSFSFGLPGNANAASASFQFGSSSAVKFSTGTSLGVTASPPLESTVASSSSSNVTSVFGSLQTTAAPVFGTSASSSSSPSTGFTFGAMSSSTSPISFGANVSSSSKSIFGSFGSSTPSNGPSTFISNGSLPASSAAPIFGSAASTSAPAPTFMFGASAANSPSQPVFGNPNPMFSIDQTSTIKNDLMNPEDIMAEDMSPAAIPPASLFGQQPVSSMTPSPNFVLGSVPNPFQFGGQHSFATTTNPSPFATPGGLDFNSSGGGSFSLGTGGGDKSGRKIIKVKHRQRRK